MKLTCFCCGKEVEKSPAQFKKSKTGNVYCSRSCAAKINNRSSPKRKKTNKCKKCSDSIHAGRIYCSSCSTGRRKVKHHTLKDVIESHIKNKKPDANLYNGIRSHARTVAYKNKDRICEKCGYDKHTEVCHIKSISEFNLDASIDDEINNIDNILILCPNCHWEFDNGLWD